MFEEHYIEHNFRKTLFALREAEKNELKQFGSFLNNYFMILLFCNSSFVENGGKLRAKEKWNSENIPRKVEHFSEK